MTPSYIIVYYNILRSSTRPRNWKLGVGLEAEIVGVQSFETFGGKFSKYNKFTLSSQLKAESGDEGTFQFLKKRIPVVGSTGPGSNFENECMSERTLCDAAAQGCRRQSLSREPREQDKRRNMSLSCKI